MARRHLHANINIISFRQFSVIIVLMCLFLEFFRFSLSLLYIEIHVIAKPL